MSVADGAAEKLGANKRARLAIRESSERTFLLLFVRGGRITPGVYTAVNWSREISVFCYLCADRAERLEFGVALDKPARLERHGAA